MHSAVSSPNDGADHSYLATDSAADIKDTAVQTDLSMHDISQLEVKLADKSSLLRKAFVENVIKNDKNVRAYTGFPSLAFLMGIFNILVTKCSSLKYWSGPSSAKEKVYQNNQRRKPDPPRKLSYFHEFILALVRLRLGMFEFCIADIFGVSKSRVSQIFITLMTFMSSVFGKLIKWPSKTQVRKYKPMSFRKNYPNTRAIIDCTEFFTLDRTAQAAIYSTYREMFDCDITIRYHNICVKTLWRQCI